MAEVFAVFWPQGVVALLVGYLFGSIPFGLVLTRLAGLGDIRAIGSGNIGATNVLRTGNKALAASTLLGDMLKGAVAVLVAEVYLGVDASLYAALGAFLGHVFPVWLRFRGGKGVATYLGCLLALAPVAALFFAVIWLSTAVLYRYSSAAALVASASMPVVLWQTGQDKVAVLYCILGTILWVRHRENIVRLIARTEPRIGQKKQ